jgi:hypothetical protein
VVRRAAHGGRDRRQPRGRRRRGRRQRERLDSGFPGGRALWHFDTNVGVDSSPTIDKGWGSGPVLLQTYKLGSATKVSGVGYDSGSATYMIASADSTAKDGRLFYIDAVSDPTPGSN